MNAYMTALSAVGGPVLSGLLAFRRARGKEDPARISERRGVPGRSRPAGPLVWLHAASVGEAQSALILIEALLAARSDIHVMVTTGTVTSARLMAGRLPPRAFHQFIPLDHPRWAERFIDHWRPDLTIWMESELWPALLMTLERKGVPVVLVNARLSPRSARRWNLIKNDISHLLDAFSLIITQTKTDRESFGQLGAHRVITGGNLKYSAAPLPHDPAALTVLRDAVSHRPLWLYASTHEGEEDLACRLHKRLREKFPGLLTIIAPRHPQRGPTIEKICGSQGLKSSRRTLRTVPKNDDDMYIADTLGELGLFYRLSPLTCVGRSFSADGGGGHNPLEPAQLGCAVLHGPHVQNLSEIYADMDQEGAALHLTDEQNFFETLDRLLSDRRTLEDLRARGRMFAQSRAAVIDHIMKELHPFLPATSKDRSCA